MLLLLETFERDGEKLVKLIFFFVEILWYSSTAATAAILDILVQSIFHQTTVLVLTRGTIVPEDIVALRKPSDG